MPRGRGPLWEAWRRGAASKVLEPIFMGEVLVRWILLGSITGILVGVSVALFLKLLFWSIAQTASLPLWQLAFVLPGGGLAAGVLIHYGAPDAAGHGTEAVIRAVHRRFGQINWKVAPIKALATICSIAVGGSAGKEGPSAQIGSALASALADLLRFSPEQRRRIVICGIGAGFAAVFGTPVAGAILGIEVLAVGSIMYEMLVPCFAAAIVSFEVAHWIGLTWNYPAPPLPMTFSPWELLRVIGLGVACGLAAYLLVQAMDGIHRVVDDLKAKRGIWPPLFPMLAGLSLFLLIALFGRAYAGLSMPVMMHALAGGSVQPYGFLLKIVFVAITLGAGMSGGIITPLFVIGATLGVALAGPLGLPPAAAAEIGMVAVTASAANVPIAAIILGMEAFGSGLSPYFLAAAIPAYILIGNHSVYPSQRLEVVKSTRVPAEIGGYLEDLPEPTLSLDLHRHMERLRERLHRKRRDHESGKRGKPPA